ncbi:MAG: hypothetical protein ABI960_06870, partial [Candidatus Eisenbacteria bacterium]
MHRALCTLALVLLGWTALAGAASAGGVVINPQAGVTATHLTSDPNEITDEARAGYTFGGNVRLGGMLYVSPGAYYQRTSLRLTVRDALTSATIKDVVGVKAIYVPLQFGINLSPNPSAMTSVGIRLHAGPALTIVTSVDDNTLGITKDDYKHTHAGFEGGVGLDLSLITIDASYEKGITDVW